MKYLDTVSADTETFSVNVEIWPKNAFIGLGQGLHGSSKIRYHNTYDFVQGWEMENIWKLLSILPVCFLIQHDIG